MRYNNGCWKMSHCWFFRIYTTTTDKRGYTDTSQHGKDFFGNYPPVDIFGKGILTFREAHRTDGWVAEHHCGNVGVVHLGVLLALKQSVCQLSACSNGNCHTQRGHIRIQ